MLSVDRDLHVHTHQSACCNDKDRMKPERILREAERIGVRTVGFADHLWANPDVPPNRFYQEQDERQVHNLRRDLQALAPSPVRALLGCEADTVAPGVFGIRPELAASLDFVLISCSHFHMTGFVEQPADPGARGLAEHLLTFFRSAVTSGLPTAIAHPFKPLGFERQYDDAIAAISDAEFLEVLGLAAQHGVALEITVSFLPRIPLGAIPGRTWSLETPLRVLTLAKEAGCRFTFGSDSHALDELERIHELQSFVTHLGLTEADVARVPARSER